MIVGSNILAGASGQAGYFLQRSVRLRASAVAYFSRTPASTGNRKTWTWSGWLKRGALSTPQQLFGSATSAPNQFALYCNANNQLIIVDYRSGVTQTEKITTQVFRDSSSWYHVVLTVDTTQAVAENRFKLYINGIQVTAFSTNTVNTLQNADLDLNQAGTPLRLGDSFFGGAPLDGYLTEINFIDSQGLTPTSFGEYNVLTGVWQPKKYVGTYGTNGFYLPFNNLSTTGGNGFSYSEDFTNAAWTKYQSTITANAIVAPNGTTTADKLIETATIGDHQVTRSFAATDNTAYTWSAYAKAGERSNFRLYLQNKAGTFNLADFDLSTGTITATSGVTAVITPVGNDWYRCSVSCNVGTGATASPAAILSYATISAGSGTNGLYIWGAQIEGSTSVVGAYYATTTTGFGTFQIGADQSLPTGGYNSWVANNISLTAGVTYDSMTDVPTLTSSTQSNFPLFNPLASTACTPAQGNLYVSTSNGWAITFGSMELPSSGKFYWEYTNTATAILANQRAAVGFAYSSSTSPRGSGTNYFGGVTGDQTYLGFNGSTPSGNFATWTTNDVVGICVDCNTGNYWYTKNGTSIYGDPATGVSPVGNLTGGASLYSPAFGNIANAGGYEFTGYVNFGQRPFSYTPPTGFIRLNTYNLPAPTIANGAEQFAATLYTGNGTTQTITNGGNNSIGKTFQPDFVWMKNRTISQIHGWFDSVRGVGNVLSSDQTSVESGGSAGVSSFNSNGFGLGNAFNNNTNAFVAWQWKASNAAAVTNTSGTISSQVSANPSAGFSIVTYTGTGTNGATFGHGLGVAPAFGIWKVRSGTVGNWVIYHRSLGATKGLNFTTGAATTSAVFFNNTAPTSTVWSLGTVTDVNRNTSTYVNYAFSEIAGYSKFGSYTGNGSADGTFIYTGMRPRWLMIKRSDSADNWVIYDTSRSAFNESKLTLYPNLSNAESADASGIDILSNGFKMRNTFSSLNVNGGTYVYAAFAENPFKLSLAR